MRRLLSRLLDVYALGTAGWLLAWKLFRDRWGVLAMANAWAFWLLSTGLPIGAVRAWQRARWLAGGWLAFGATAATLLSIRTGTLLPWERLAGNERVAVPVGGTPLHVMTLNLLKHSRDVTPFVAQIRRESPDLVVFQELTPYLAERLEADLRDTYPYRYWAPGDGAAGLGLVGRHPFATTGCWDRPGIEPFALRATLTLPDGPLDVYAVHLIAPAGDHLFETGLTGNFRLREAQVAHILGEIERQPPPAIVVGDCNMTESNEAYRQMTAGLTDAWPVAGRGFGWTWPRNMQPFLDAPVPPLLRLDYCFYTDGVVAEEARVLNEVASSDHCPLSVRLRVA